MVFLTVSLMAACSALYRYLIASLPADAKRTLLISLPILVVAGTAPVLPKLRTEQQVRDSMGVPSYVLLLETTKLLLTLGAMAVVHLLHMRDRAQSAARMASLLESSKEHGDALRRAEDGTGPLATPALIVIPDNSAFPARSNWLRAKTVLRFALIALLYAAINNLKMFALLSLDAATYALLNNMSVLTTALFYRIVFRRPFTSYQLVALLLLVTGLVVSKLTLMTTGAAHHVTGDTAAAAGATAVFVQGLAIMIVASLLASIADVGNEYVFKDTQHPSDSFLSQSLSLYVFGVLFSGICFVLWNRHALWEEIARVLHPDPVTAIMALFGSVGGISIGLCFRFTRGGNLNKLFADAGALLLTLVLNFALLRIAPTLELVCAIVVIYCAIYVFSSESLKSRGGEHT